ncbi:MAG: NUDIX hydrolase [Magnetococcales bacterium]|nr:NUDIX hydrolase [Magnetococcales bacterium]
MIIRPCGVLVEKGMLLSMHYLYGEQDRYNLPGGKPEGEEGLASCLIREFQEELYLDVEVVDLVVMAETSAAGRHVLHPVFTVRLCDPDQAPQLNPEQTSAQAVVWLPLEKVAHYTLYPAIESMLVPALSSSQKLSPKRRAPIYLGKINQPWF